MESKWVGIRAMREGIPKMRGGAEEEIDRLKAGVADLKKCLAGDSSSSRWQLLKVELTNKEEELLHAKRRFVGRTPQMESWADPLP